MSPTMLTLRDLRKQGYQVGKTEQTIVPKRRDEKGKLVNGVPFKRDLFGFVDIVAVHPEKRGVLFVQCTSLSNMHGRLGKMRHTPEVRAAVDACLAAGNRVEVWAWEKRGNRWRAKIKNFAVVSEVWNDDDTPF